MITAYSAIFTAILFFSTIEVAVKLVNTTITDPIFLAFLRFMPAGILLLMLDYKTMRKYTKKDFLHSFALALIGIVAGFSAYHISLLHLPASTGAVIFSINPIITVVTAAIILKETIRGRAVYGIVLGFAGVYIVSFGFSIVNFRSVKGPVLMVLSSLCFGIFLCGAKPLVKKHGPLITTGVIFIMGSLFLIPLIRSWHLPLAPLQVLTVAYLIIFATALGYVLYFFGLSRVPVAAGNSLFYLKPPVATVLSVLLLGERLNTTFFIGLALIMSGLALTTFPGASTMIKKRHRMTHRGPTTITSPDTADARRDICR